MVKGVSRAVIEVKDPACRWIERAILFISPEKADSPSPFLQKKAEDYLQKTDAELGACSQLPHAPLPLPPQKKNRGGLWFLSLLSFLSGAAVMYGLTALIRI